MTRPTSRTARELAYEGGADSIADQEEQPARYVMGPAGIRVERYNGITGSSLSSIPARERVQDLGGFDDLSHKGDFRTTSVGNNYLHRGLALFQPQADGQYGFFVNGDDHTELRVGSAQSSDSEFFTRDDAVSVANNRGQNGQGSWSRRYNMLANETYFLEAY